MLIMALNIKNPEVTGLVREYAKRTGLTQTSAIEDALRKALAQLDAEDQEAAWSETVAARLEGSRQILSGIAIAPPGERDRINEILFDEAGLCP